MRLRMTKLETVQKPVGELTLEEGYWVEGHVQALPEVGKSLVMMRDTRNGVRMLGTFATSPVVKIEGNVIHTNNSRWQYEVKDERSAANFWE